MAAIRLLSIIFCFWGTEAHIKLCENSVYESRATGTETNKAQSCPHGVLFEEPVILEVVENIGDEKLQMCVQRDICSAEPVKCMNITKYVEAQLIIPNYPGSFGKTSSDVLFPSHLSYDENCNSFEISRTDNNRIKRRKRQVENNPTFDDKHKNPDRVIQSVIDEKTKKMFYYLSGVSIEDVSSHLRVTKLFHTSVRLVHMICDPLFLKEGFLESVEQGFMFLLKQQGLERITDADVEDYEMLQRALDYCMGEADATVTIEGNHCPANFYITSLQKLNVKMPFNKADESNFSWGKHDIVVDAAWHMIDIVHGICFSTLKESLNLHHKYQVVMEQLFHDSIHLYWNSPTKFQREDRIDNVFTVPVNSSMEVLDACAQGAYIGSPFVHRLQRPEIMRPKNRKKRSFTLDEHLHVSYCFQSAEELANKRLELRQKQCKDETDSRENIIINV